MTRRRAAVGALLLVALTVLITVRITEISQTDIVELVLHPHPGSRTVGSTSTSSATSSTAMSYEIPTEGILRIYGVSSVGVGTNFVPTGEVHSSSIALLYNTGSSPLVITKAVPISIEHLHFVDVGFMPDDAPTFAGAKYFPQEPSSGGGLRPAMLPYELPGAGRQLPLGPGDTFPIGQGLGTTLMAGYALEDGQTFGHLHGLRLTYVVDGEEHQLDVPVELFLCSSKCPDPDDLPH